MFLKTVYFICSAKLGVLLHRSCRAKAGGKLESSFKFRPFSNGEGKKKTKKLVAIRKCILFVAKTKLPIWISDMGPGSN